MTADNWETASAVLHLASQLTDGIQAGLARRGFDDVRPAHGFAFVRISAGDANISAVAEHLGITKQAAAEMVRHLVDRQYVTRKPDARDARAQLLLLTGRGWACTAAAEAAAAEVVQQWRSQLDPRAFEQFAGALRSVTAPGRLRPSW